MDEELVSELDCLVDTGAYETRSEALEAAVRLLLAERREQEFERNLGLLVPEEERADAELGMRDWTEGLAADEERAWPEWRDQVVGPSSRDALG